MNPPMSLQLSGGPNGYWVLSLVPCSGLTFLSRGMERTGLSLFGLR